MSQVSFAQIVWNLTSCVLWSTFLSIAVSLIQFSLVPSPLLAHARKDLVKRVTLPCPGGTYSVF